MGSWRGWQADDTEPVQQRAGEAKFPCCVSRKFAQAQGVEMSLQARLDMERLS